MSSQTVSLGAGIFTVLLGIIGWIGWLFDIETLKTVLPGLNAMKPNTASGFLLAGTAMSIIANAQAKPVLQWMARIASGLVTLLGLATLVQHVLPLELGIDTLLLNVPPTETNPHPARMTMQAASLFSFLGLALLFLSWRRSYAVVQLLMGCVLLICFATFVCYLFGIVGSANLPTLKITALHTAMGFTVLAIGILAASMEAGFLRRFRENVPTIFFAVGMSLLILSGLASITNTLRATQTNVQVTQTYAAIRHLEAILLEVQQNVSGYRGFALTGQERFVEPLALSRTRLWSNLTALQRQSLNLSERNTNLAILKTLLDRRIKMADEKIAIRHEQGLDAVAQAVATGEGDRLNDHIKQHIEAMQDLEQRLLAQYQAGAQSSTNNAYVALAFSGAIGLCLIVSVQLGLRRQIAQRKRVETDRDRMISILEATPDLVGMADPQAHILYMNRAGRSMTGLGDKPVSQIHLADLYPAWASELLFGQGIPAAIEWGAWSGETALLSEDKTEIPVSQVILSHRDEQGKLSYLSTIIRDISKRKRIEAELQRFKSTLDRTQDCVFMFDPITLRFFYVNKGATEQVGYSMEELLEMTPLDIKPEFDESGFRAMIAPMLDGEYSAVNFETVHRHKDGHDVAVEIALQYVAPFNEPSRFIAIVRDISKRKQAEMELSRYRDRLEEMVQDRTIELKVINQELEAFAYSVSHDLRAPLRAIDGFSQALLEDYADRLDDQGRNYLNRVRAATQRMGRLIDDLLTLSRISRAVFNPQTVDLSNLANEIVQQLRDADPARRIETSVQEGLKVRGDWGLLKVTLENLLGNAWKYTGKRVAPRVDFGSLERDGEIIYYVRDNGVGFDMQHADKLFGAFQRLHHRDEFEGTGVGLATVKRIVNRHGGRIWAESAPNEQTTFYFTLPLGEAGEPNNVAKQTP